MKQLLLEDLWVLSKIFSPLSMDLVVLAAQDFTEEKSTQNIYYSIAELQAFLQQNPHGEYTLINLSNQRITDVYLLENISTILNFGKAYSDKDELKIDYINNPNGTIRWLYPSAAKKPYFLNLYNGNGLRAMMIERGFKMCWKLGLNRVAASGRFSICTKTKLPLEHYLDAGNTENWALFTGTVGENRKLILETNDGEQTTHFTKIPITEKAAQLVHNEYLHLQQINECKLSKSEMPLVEKKGGAIQLSNVKPAKPLNSTRIQTQHIKALFEWYNRSHKVVAKEELKQFDQISDKLQSLKGMTQLNNGLDLAVITEMTKQLDTLFERLKSHSHFTVGLAHGDFTPWNLFLTEDKIHVYDWELADTACPLLYDLFHFVFQSSILLEKVGFETIHQRLEDLRSSSLVQVICMRFDIDFDQQKQFYLLYTISYYLNLYTRQEHLHTQAHWLVKCWQLALQHEVEPSNKEIKGFPKTKIRNFIPKMG